MTDVRTAGDLTRPVIRARAHPDAEALAVRALMRRTLRAATLAEIGELAIGIIHEINNPVSCIRSNTTLLLQYLPHLARLAARTKRAGARADDGGHGAPGPQALCRDVREILDDLEVSVELITSITRNLKSLAYSAHDEPKETDLHQCIEAALRVAHHELRYRVRVEKEFGAVPTLVAYPGLLIQVFLNLFVNAAHAIEGEGTLRIRTRCDGSNALVEVADSGLGIAPAHVSRIFAPFFTTKGAGEGLGLGLSICKGIIDRHGGDIRVSSSPGKGTTFHIRLPVKVTTSRALAPGPRGISDDGLADRSRRRAARAAPMARSVELC